MPVNDAQFVTIKLFRSTCDKIKSLTQRLFILGVIPTNISCHRTTIGYCVQLADRLLELRKNGSTLIVKDKDGVENEFKLGVQL